MSGVAAKTPRRRTHRCRGAGSASERMCHLPRTARWGGTLAGRPEADAETGARAELRASDRRGGEVGPSAASREDASPGDVDDGAGGVSAADTVCRLFLVASVCQG